ncbi:MAG: hypothetical protein ABWY25_03665 [Paenisporosarcina sp.]
MRKVMLTTIDNPHSPFDDFMAWHSYDVASGYHTAEFLGRIVKDSTQLSEADQDLALEWAVDECVEENVLGIYKKVEKEFPD